MIVIQMEGGVIQEIYATGDEDIVVIDNDISDEDDEAYVEYLNAYVSHYAQSPLSFLDADVMEAVCKHLDLELPNATNGATPPQDSQ